MTARVYVNLLEGRFTPEMIWDSSRWGMKKSVEIEIYPLDGGDKV